MYCVSEGIAELLLDGIKVKWADRKEMKVESRWMTDDFRPSMNGKGK